MIIYLQNIRKKLLIPDYPLNNLRQNQNIYTLISQKLNYSVQDFYLINKVNNKVLSNTSIISLDDLTNKQLLILDIHFRERGGFILDLISQFFEMILYPIVYPLKGILQAFLMMIKAIMYIIALAIYAIKVIVWFFADFLPSIPGDITAFIQYFTNLLFDVLFGTIMYYARKLFNIMGRMTIKGIMGWDNTPNDNTKGDANAAYFNNECSDSKCYKTPDGTVPFSVIIATILCPPVGVFMEYGVMGWFNILIAAILTLMFYFPGLIYALILLYC